MIFLELKSPNSDEIAIFNWKHSSLTAHEGNNEILQAIRYICQDIGDERFRNFLAQHVESTTFNNFEKMKSVCDSFNRLVDQVIANKEFTRPEHHCKPLASPDLLKFVMLITYNRAVVEPEKLNQYEPFSPQVYGETSFDLIEQMLKKTTLKEADLFMDLGSGVGNVVLQVAGSVRCKLCFGVEKAEWPAFYAVRLENEFRFWMGFFGKYFSKFKIYKGDFLSEEQMIEVEEASSPAAMRTISMGEYVKELINEANLVFVNNYAFGATVDHELKMRFCNMQEGSLIVSSKPFCSLTFRINSRNLNDIGTILNTHDIEPVCGHVSWTDKPISYYFQRIDRTNLEKYFERLKNPSKFKDENDNSNHNDSMGSHSSGSASSSTSSSPASSPNSNGSSSRFSNDARKSKSRRSNKSSTNTSSHSPSSNFKSKENRKRKSDPGQPSTGVEDGNPTKKTKIGLHAAKSGDKPSSVKSDTMATLSRMHEQSLQLALTNSIKTASKTNGADFNINGLTRLNRENCDVKPLSDCKILTKYSANIFNELNEKGFQKAKLAPVPIANDRAPVDLDHSNPHVIEDGSPTDEFGGDIINSLDHYLRKCRHQYIKYLKYMMSDACKEKLKAQLADQAERKRQLLAKISSREEQIKSLTSSGIRLIKTKTSELGLKNVKTPNDLVEYARTLVADNHSLLNRIKSLQETVNNLETKLSKLGHKNLLSGGMTTSVLDGLTIDGTVLLDKILNHTTKDSSSVKARLPDLLKCNDQERSVSRSTNSTMTATEREMDEDSQGSGSSSRTSETGRSKHANKPSSKHGDKAKIRVKSENEEEKRTRKPNSPSLNGKSILEQIFPSTALSALADSKLDSLRNFKIPRTTTSPLYQNEAAKKCKSPSTPPDSPSSMSSASSSSSSSGKAGTGTIAAKETSLSSSSLSRQTSLSASSDSNSNMAAPSSRADGATAASTSTTAYYHPKKSQFRQYLMESSAPTPGTETAAPDVTETTKKIEARTTRWSPPAEAVPISAPTFMDQTPYLSPPKTLSNKLSTHQGSPFMSFNNQQLPHPSPPPPYYHHNPSQLPPSLHLGYHQATDPSDYSLTNHFHHPTNASPTPYQHQHQYLQQHPANAPKFNYSKK